MIKKIPVLLISLLVCFYLPASNNHCNNTPGWKAGVSNVVITPAQPMWIAGYSDRNHPSEGTLQDLQAKALALEDGNGNQVVLVTADLVGIPKSFSDRVRSKLGDRFHLSKSQIILNVSHTHSGPVLTDGDSDIYPLDSVQQQKVDQYTHMLADKIINLVGAALRSMQPAQLYAANGIARFQVNRRNNNESKLRSHTQLKGPNDYAVPVIKVVNAAGKLIAVAFGYACHNTVLSDYQWSGDYAGFAQSDLETIYPGVTALFFQGCGGDQNPLPRRTVALAQQYGTELGAAVSGVLNEGMRQLQPTLSTAYSEIELSLATLPTKDELSKKAKESSGYERRWATRLVKELERGDSLRKTYPYPIAIWKLGDQPIIILGGEVVIDYAIYLKQLFGQDLFVLGYSNDVMGYIPTAAMLREGGYEATTSQIASGLPGMWAPEIEISILQEITRLSKQVGLVQPELKIIY